MYMGGYQSQFVYICHITTASNIRNVGTAASLSDIVTKCSYAGDFNYPNIDWESWSALDSDSGSNVFLEAWRINFYLGMYHPY